MSTRSWAPVALGAALGAALVTATACEPALVRRPAAPPATATVTLPSAPAAATTSQPAAAAPDVPAACDRLAQEQRRALSAARRPEDGAALSAAELDMLPAELGRCLPAGSGAWSVLLTDLSKFEEVDLPGGPSAGAAALWGYQGFLAYGFAAAGGELATMNEPLAGFAGLSDLSVQSATVHDYDGDGTAELASCLSFQQLQQRHAFVLVVPYEAVCRVLTCRGDRVTSYPPADPWRIEAIRDVDADGRPDLLTRSPLPEVGRIRDGYCSLHECDQHGTRGPLLMAHARPDGSFASDDPVAVAHARKACPQRPHPIFPGSGRTGADFAAGVQRLVCARIWGATEADLRPELDGARRRFCRDVADCEELAELDRWVTDPAEGLPSLR